MTLSKLKMHNLIRFYIWNVPANNKNVYDFLMNFPTGVRDICFNADNESLTPIDYYFKHLISNGRKVTDVLEIYHFEMTCKQLWKIV